MASNPINLAFRFILELAALVAMGYWGWNTGEGWTRWFLMLGVPLIAAALWGVFRVDNDPGRAPVRVPGILRLVLELAYFAFAVWALNDAGATTASWILGIAVLVHYLISYDRVLWLVRGKKL
ncbi:MAG: hypothetical protein A2W35_09190 [Chloroflexi bacterium RBG_16_57_11]|nr:MAG: hypothetical protein A2W35_09190 [Chloroflexi bacterium RBG_16_57_11]